MKDGFLIFNNIWLPPWNCQG